MKIVTGSDYAFRRRWNAVDAVLFWFKCVAQWLCRPLLGWGAYILRHGVPPPAMVFPDSPSDRAQFPTLSSLGFVFPSASALDLWDDGGRIDEPLAGALRADSTGRSAKDRPLRPVSPPIDR